jgi:hypothetical protein
MFHGFGLAIGEKNFQVRLLLTRAGFGLRIPIGDLKPQRIPQADQLTHFL